MEIHYSRILGFNCTYGTILVPSKPSHVGVRIGMETAVKHKYGIAYCLMMYYIVYTE